MVWGKLRFSVDHHAGKGDPRRFIDAFVEDPTQLSPLTTGSRRVGNTTYGKPIPLPGMEIGVRPTRVSERRLPDGGSQVSVDVQYSGAFSGPGRITATRYGGSSELHVRDEWLGVDNNTAIPSFMAEAGHAGVVDVGFRNLAKKSR
jgi:hypothetical protein